MRESEERVGHLGTNTHSTVCPGMLQPVPAVGAELACPAYEDGNMQRMYALLARIPEGLEPLRKGSGSTSQA